MLDDDPIDIIASNNRVSVLRYAVPRRLILFADQYQFRFNAADTALTPSTAQITVLTQFDVDNGPTPAGRWRDRLARSTVTGSVSANFLSGLVLR